MMTAALFVLFLCVFCSMANAASISITSPAAGATVNCGVMFTATTSFTPPEYAVGTPTFYFTSNGNTTSQSGNSVTWNSTLVPNGTVTVTVSVSYRSGYNPNTYTVNSAPITVTVKNGFIQVTDPAKTYAKMTQPKDGNSIVDNGQSFSITSDHQITWTRYDNCQTDYVPYEFKLTTTYSSGSFVTVDDQTGTFIVPGQAGDYAKTLTLGTSKSFIAGGPAPVTYYNYA